MASKEYNIMGYDGNGYFVNKTVTPSALYTLAVPSLPYVNTLYKGKKQYELGNHLGNVLATISDRRIGIDDNADLIIDYYNPDILSLSDYYAFGSAMPGRSLSVKGYRYGFNTQEKEDEVYGEGNSTSAEFWQYDARLGRRWNVDPVPQIFVSDYACFTNNPIMNVDIKGDKSSSRHLDPDGKIIADYDDGDNGVYKHQTARTKGDVDYWRKHFNNTSGNGIKIGEMYKLSIDGSVLSFSPKKENYSVYYGNLLRYPQLHSNNNSSNNNNSNNNNSNNNNSNNNNNFYDHILGPTLILLGQPIKALKPIGVFGSAPGSSIASYTLSKTIPITFTKTLGKKTGTQIAKTVGTNVVGRGLGRLVPL
jgi:hypothetical protein